MPRFTATIFKVGVLRCVVVPPTIVTALGGAVRIPVIARYAGETTVSTIVPASGKQRRLTLRMDVLRPAQLDAGDKLAVNLVCDTGPREPALPVDLQRALQFRPRAQAAYRNTTVSIRRQIVRFLDAAKQATTRQSRLEDVIEKLADNRLH